MGFHVGYVSKFKVRIVGLAAAAACVLAVGPLTSQASAQTPTSIKAYSIVADVNDTNVQARVPLRPSARLWAHTAAGKVPLANHYITFFAAGQPLCAERTDETGYAECKGIVRILYPTLALGRYRATFPGTSQYHGSTDYGQILQIGRVQVIN